MLGKAKSVALCGLKCELVNVEVDILLNLPKFIIVGLGDATVQESRERIQSAVKNSGFPYPRKRIVVNLAPAHLRKMGPHYDLPVALALLITQGVIDQEDIQDTIVVGEIALDGSVRPVTGILPMTEFAAEKGFKKIIVPVGNASEASLIKGIKIVPIDHLSEIKAVIKGEKQHKIKPPQGKKAIDYSIDMADIKGQYQAKRALEIAAAGGHNLLLNGAPGAGKTMMAKALRSILPTMNTKEALEVSKIYSVAGKLNTEMNLILERPFRIIHHTASAVSIVGGGNPPHPGEISLAHRGILFLDELAEFPKQVLEVLRQPMEDQQISISRAQGSYTYPAHFTLIAAMNPCPCGYHGIPHPIHRCQCYGHQIQRYQKKISGPMLDRIDLHLFINPVEPKYFSNQETAETSAKIRERVETARQIQQKRFKAEAIQTNSEMNNRLIKKYALLSTDAESFLQRASEQLGYSARSYYRLIKVARTIADLTQKESIESADMAEALQYRQRET